MEFVEPYNRLSPPVWMLTPAVFVASLLITFVMRLWLSTLGHNFDFESYMEVVGLMERGKNVYAETCRYNYAPAWMWILLGLKTAFGAQFRLAVAVVPSLADIAIAWLLYRRGNKLPALLFVWAPVCIMISGFHNQFDNLAILIALLAVRYAETRTNYDSSLPNWGLR
ncbi:MAG: hypothetical protein EBZ77_10945, partial [Chitinophagia bacterium]|nr:hypothetical protein [Chitinophagia bacterium]